jgi:hypothetical protein
MELLVNKIEPFPGDILGKEIPEKRAGPVSCGAGAGAEPVH